jgi:hypothetical protein
METEGRQYPDSEPVPLELFSRHMHMTTAELKKIAWEYDQTESDCGIRFENKKWIVYPNVFHRNVLSLRNEIHVRRPHSSWDGNLLLQQSGFFFLRDVAELLPFTPNQLRYQAQIRADPRTEIGIFKYAPLESYLVEMPAFSRWITALWNRPDV